MTDAENSLKEQKENAQVATEQPPIKPPFRLIPDIQVPKKAAAAAKAMGIDLQGIVSFAPVVNDWAASIEDWKDSVNKTLDTIIKALPELPQATINLLKQEAEKQRAERQQQIQQTTTQPQAQGGTREALMSAAPEIIGAVREALKSGGGGDDILKTLAMESLKADIDFSRSLKSAVLSKFTSKVTGELAETLGT